MGYPSKPILKSTRQEYLLFIHPSLKERAKVVSGYSWDARRKCWVYPKTNRIYDALISEFGEEIELQTARQPEPSKATKHDEGSLSSSATLDHAMLAVTAPISSRPRQEMFSPLEQTNQALQVEITKLRDIIEGISKSKNSNSDDDRALEHRLTEREKDIAFLQRKLAEAETEIEELKRSKVALCFERDDLKATLREKSSIANAEQLVRSIALEATGKDAKFSALLGRLHLDQTLPLVVHRQLEQELRSALGIGQDDRSYDTLQLIQQAYDKGVLPKDAVDHAHTIRKQRNIMAHADGYQKTYEARILMCLLAAALLWPELPE